MLASYLSALFDLLYCSRVHIGDLREYVKIRPPLRFFFNLEVCPLTMHLLLLGFRFCIKGGWREKHRGAIEELDVSRFNSLTELGIGLHSFDLQTPPSLITF